MWRRSEVLALCLRPTFGNAQRRRTADRRPLHQDESAAFHMSDDALRDNRGHKCVGVVDALPAAENGNRPLRGPWATCRHTIAISSTVARTLPVSTSWVIASAPAVGGGTVRL
jgi:hypothetical protein